MGGGALIAALFLPAYCAPVILAILAALSLMEFYAMLDASHIPHFKVIGTIGGTSLIVVTWLAERGIVHQLGPNYETSILFVIFASCFLRQLFHVGKERAWETTAGTLLGIVYVAFLMNFFVKLLVEFNTSVDDAQGRYLILFLVVVVKLTDVGAYFTGSLIGRHKLIPRVSPAKTWEGCAGGVAAGVGAGVLLGHLYSGHAGVHVFNLQKTILIAALTSVAGILGDLIESLFKRAAGVKDSGSSIRGMGGILDVLDSLLFAAPVLYIAARVVS